MVRNGNDQQQFLAGVDGCKAGWVVVSEMIGGRLSVDVISLFSEIMDRHYRVLVVDVPIGLLDRGTRLADQEARHLLRQRACCVFTAPLRPMLDCSNYAEARKLRLETEGKSLTKQAWAIVPKIKEVDHLLSPEAQTRIREGHPEVSFAHMNAGKPLASSKHTLKGQHDRLNLVATHFSDVPSLVQKHSRFAGDVLDACAMLWTAQRVQENRALALPKESPVDSRGLLMQIWA